MTSSSSSAPKADILVVDDIPDNIRFLASMLKEQGFHVRPAINGQIALRAAQTSAPDLILLDINMPNMDGYTVCHHLKDNPQTREIPVIFLSALNDAKDKVKAFEVGAADYISKPFFIEEVLARISHQLELTRLQRELAQRNTQLNDTVNQLQQAQSQLVHSEKMSAVNQLVAGLAHELNNPITFIYGNLSYAQDYVKELVELALLYQQEYPQPSPVIQEMIEELDLDFLYRDLQHVLQSMQTGTERIRKIITGLKDFSRFDEQGRKLTDIHQALESTLNILEHRLNPHSRIAIAITQQYDELPQIVCSPGQLNQVFYHILVNSIDAIETKIAQAIADYQPQIQIRTILEGKWLTIELIDNGIGIELEHQTRLFEPFFTAKPIGQGTGLGLAIAYQIVVKEHQGRLTCTSELGQGTTMTVRLPLDLPLFSNSE